MSRCQLLMFTQCTQHIERACSEFDVLLQALTSLALCETRWTPRPQSNHIAEC